MPSLLLLRHAQSAWNAEGRWQGWADPPLSEKGEAQVTVAARTLTGQAPFDLVVSSDLQRARRTADLLASALGAEASVVVEPGLREYHVAAWSGLTTPEIEQGWPGGLDRFRRGLQVPPGGEARRVFDARVAAAGRAVCEKAGALAARKILVVTHGGVVRSLAGAAGLVPGAVGHLAGYWGRCATGLLLPLEEVDLLASKDGI